MEKYKVVKSFGNHVLNNPKVGTILTRKRDDLFDENGKWVCEMDSLNQRDYTELIK